MSYLFPFFSASVVASITPGPNNGLLMRSGMIFGIKKTIPHILGIIVGFNLLFISIRLGLYQVITYYPASAIVLKIIGTLYFSYLAYKMIRSSSFKINIESNTQAIKPFSFMQALLFQWVNIKAWFFCTSVVSLIPIDLHINQNILLQLGLMTINTCSALAWAILGLFISKLFSSPKYIRLVSIAFAILLLYSGISPWV